MTQLSIMIALLAALALGNATSKGINPVQHSEMSGSEKASLPERDSLQGHKVEPPKEQLGGGGEGGFPGF